MLVRQAAVTEALKTLGIEVTKIGTSVAVASGTATADTIKVVLTVERGG